MDKFGRIRTIHFYCHYCEKEIPFSPAESESDEDAKQRHYRAPIHHDYHIHYLGEPCFCGIDGSMRQLWDVYGPPGMRHGKWNADPDLAPDEVDPWVSLVWADLDTFMALEALEEEMDKDEDEPVA